MGKRVFLLPIIGVM